MATKKTEVIKVIAKKDPVKIVKATVKAAAPAKKEIVKKEEVEKKTVKTSNVHVKVQTAEGWKRMMKRDRDAKKKL